MKLVALYGPEHGVRGNAQAGEYVPFYFDEHFKLPVFSLYGQTHKPPADMMTNIDEYMRSFDTKHEGKQVEAGMMQSVDVMVFDLQDVGTRVYTYIATMAYAMQAAADADIPFIVLDRPNPINGVAMEGPILEYPQHSSFIGLYPIPLRHGMTAGELAQLFNAKFLTKKCQLTVVPMENWTRDEWFDETSLPWVLPSPNLPTLESATVYPGQVMMEGTNLSEGRGTTKPFEMFGAPWIDGFVLAKKLNDLQPAGREIPRSLFHADFLEILRPAMRRLPVARHGSQRISARRHDAGHFVGREANSTATNWNSTPSYFDKVHGHIHRARGAGTRRTGGKNRRRISAGLGGVRQTARAFLALSVKTFHAHYN